MNVIGFVRMSGPKQGRAVLHRKSCIVVGSGDDADVIVDDPAVYPAHLTVTQEGEDVIAQGVGGLRFRVGDQVVDHAALHGGESVTVGDSLLQFRVIVQPHAFLAPMRIAGSQRFTLEGVEGPLAGTTLSFDTGPVRIGTGPNADAKLARSPDRPELARVELVAGTYALVAAAGVEVRVNGQLVERSPLVSGDTVDLDRTHTLVFREVVPDAFVGGRTVGTDDTAEAIPKANPLLLVLLLSIIAFLAVVKNQPDTSGPVDEDATYTNRHFFATWSMLSAGLEGDPLEAGEAGSGKSRRLILKQSGKLVFLLDLAGSGERIVTPLAYGTKGFTSTDSGLARKGQWLAEESRFGPPGYCYRALTLLRAALARSQQSSAGLPAEVRDTLVATERQYVSLVEDLLTQYDSAVKARDFVWQATVLVQLLDRVPDPTNPLNLYVRDHLRDLASDHSEVRSIVGTI